MTLIYGMPNTNILKRKMTYKNIFDDSDILLDLLLEREPFNRFSKLLFQESKSNRFKLYTSTLIFANIHYLITKAFDRHVAKGQLKVLSGMIDILSFERDNLLSALNSEHVDFEDTVQFHIAQKSNCDLIVSRNTKHYKKFDLPALTAEQFLRTL